MKIPILVIIISLFVVGCSSVEKAQEIVDASIIAHGLDLTAGKTISFDFRDKAYSVSYEKEAKIYTRSFQDEKLGRIKDVLINSEKFSRYVNDTLIHVDEEWSKKYSSSVNSVLYFFQLPIGLNDPAVIKEYLGQSFINQQTYHKIKITFHQKEGGDDHQDVFVYWFNDQTRYLDYLAYSYETDGGGVRFRQAVNRRKISGFIFQDYINFEPIGTNIELVNLDQSFESGKLKELSWIENENIRVD